MATIREDLVGAEAIQIAIPHRGDAVWGQEMFLCALSHMYASPQSGRF